VTGNATGKAKKKAKTKKEIKEKLEALKGELKKVDAVIRDPQGLLPPQVNKAIDLKLQLMGAVGILEWVLGDKENG